MQLFLIRLVCIPLRQPLNSKKVEEVEEWFPDLHHMPSSDSYEIAKQMWIRIRPAGSGSSFDLWKLCDFTASGSSTSIFSETFKSPITLAVTLPKQLDVNKSYHPIFINPTISGTYNVWADDCFATSTYGGSSMECWLELNYEDSPDTNLYLGTVSGGYFWYGAEIFGSGNVSSGGKIISAKSVVQSNGCFSNVVPTGHATRDVSGSCEIWIAEW
jgi:hypothetical protein